MSFARSNKSHSNSFSSVIGEVTLSQAKEEKK